MPLKLRMKRVFQTFQDQQWTGSLVGMSYRMTFDESDIVAAVVW